MAKIKSSRQKKPSPEAPFGGKRGLWKGHISFGLVTIPVQLHSAKEQKEIHFKMIDPKNNGPVGYKYYNRSTGKELKQKETVKAFEYKKGNFVVFTSADFKQANPVATQTIDIENFVSLEEIDPVYFDRAYYLAPLKGGEKAYSLLCEALERSQKVAIAKFVLHTKQHLVSLIPRSGYLLLELMHFASDVREISELKDWRSNLKISKNAQQEVKMAERLIEDMTSKWNPEDYQDTYRDDILKRVKAKVKAGKAMELTEESEEVSEREATSAKALDLMPLLRKSLESRKRRSPPTRQRVTH